MDVGITAIDQHDIYSFSLEERDAVSIRYYEQVDSTNSALMRAIKAQGGIGKPLAAVAKMQLAGRGRRGRSWLNTEGALLMSVAFNTSSLDGKKLPMATMAAAVALRRALMAFCDGVSIKWPNDIHIRQKKVCGILSELCSNGNESHVVIGVGVNINATDFPDGLLQPCTSLRLEAGKRICEQLVFESVLSNLISTFMRLLQGGEEELSLRSEYEQCCKTLGSKVKVIGTDSSNCFFGTAVAIDEIGRLIVVDEANQRRVVSAADVSVR